MALLYGRAGRFTARNLNGVFSSFPGSGPAAATTATASRPSGRAHRSLAPVAVAPLAFSIVIQFCVALLYGCTGRLRAHNVTAFSDPGRLTPRRRRRRLHHFACMAPNAKSAGAITVTVVVLTTRCLRNVAGCIFLLGKSSSWASDAMFWRGTNGDRLNWWKLSAAK